jgi:Domain of unknown function (DUF4864)
MIRRLRFLCGALWVCLLLPGAAGAAVLAEADARAVRQVVQAQLEAFATDDAERAFSYASASIQTQFGDAATFIAMVRSGYPMVVRPAAVSFFQPQADDAADRTAASVRQAVQLRDREGSLWIATYLLERQPDNGWRISGCVVSADNDKSST